MKWLSVHIGGQRWGVWIVSPKSKHLRTDQGAQLYGCCNYEKCRIYLSSKLEAPVREDVLLHELLHALLYVTDADTVYDGDAAKDEHIVKSLTPALHRLLIDLGFKFPKGPND